MTDHPHQLYPVEFQESDQARLAGLSCGDEVWSKHVAEWILGSDVFSSMERGARVWLFENAEGDIVRHRVDPLVPYPTRHSSSWV